jgi:hypothetical protein
MRSVVTGWALSTGRALKLALDEERRLVNDAVAAADLHDEHSLYGDLDIKKLYMFPSLLMEIEKNAEVMAAQGFSVKQFRSVLSQVVETADGNEPTTTITDPNTGIKIPVLHETRLATDVPCLLRRFMLQLHRNNIGSQDTDCCMVSATDMDIDDVESVSESAATGDIDPDESIRWPLNTLGSRPTLRADKTDSRCAADSSLTTRTALFWWDSEYECMRIGLLIVPGLLSGNHAMFTVQLLERYFMNARTKTPTDASFDVYTTMTANSQVTTTGPTEWALTKETVIVPAVAVDFTCDAWQEFTQRRNKEAEYWSVNAADNSNA